MNTWKFWVLHIISYFFNTKAMRSFIHSFIPAFPFLSLFFSQYLASDANCSQCRPYFLDGSQERLNFIHFPRGFFWSSFTFLVPWNVVSSHGERVVHNEAGLNVKKDLMMALLWFRALLSAGIWLLHSHKQSTLCRRWHLPPDSGGLVSPEGVWKDAVTSGASALP